MQLPWLVNNHNCHIIMTVIDFGLDDIGQVVEVLFDLVITFLLHVFLWWNMLVWRPYLECVKREKRWKDLKGN